MIRNQLSIRDKFHYRQGGWKYSGGVRLLLFVLLGVLFYFTLSGRLVPETYDIVPNTPAESTIRLRTAHPPSVAKTRGWRRRAAERQASSWMPPGSLSRPSLTRSFHVSEGPFGTSTIEMHPGTGQTSWHRLQPTHSGSSIQGTRSPAMDPKGRGRGAFAGRRRIA